MQKSSNLQDVYLANVRKNRSNVTMFLMNGYQLRGMITGYDSFTVVLNSDGRQQVIYKHAISTIVAEQPVDLNERELGGGSRQRL
jgi:host factor-I protein